MSIAAPIRVTQPRTRVGARLRAVPADVPALLVLGIGCLALAVLTWGTWGDLGSDTGYDWLAAARVADGELPYVDYVYYYGPLGPLVLGSIYALFGAGAGPAVALGLVLAVAIVGLTYALARSFTTPVPAVVAAALAATAAFDAGNTSVVLAHTVGAPMAVALALGGILALVRFERTDRAAWLVAAGLAAGLGALTRPETIAAWWLALAAWLLLRGRTAERGRDLALIAVPAVAVPLLAYGAFAAAVGPGELITGNLFPVGQLGDAGKNIVRAAAPLTASSVFELFAHLVAYGAGAAALVIAAAWATRPGRSAIAVKAALLLGGLAALAVLAQNPEAVRSRLDLAYAWIPAGAAVALGVVLSRYRGAAPTDRSRLRLLATFLTLLLVLSLPVYGQFLPFATLFSSKSAYVMPAAAIFLVWLHGEELARFGPLARRLGIAFVAFLALAGTVLVVRDARNQSVTVSGPQGTLSADAATAPALQAALDVITDRTKPGDPVLLGPQLTGLYVMSGRSNPLPTLSLLPGALDGPEAEREAITRLGDVRLAIIDRRPFTEYGHGAFGSTFDQELARWVRSNFTRLVTLRGAGPTPRIFDVWTKE